MRIAKAVYRALSFQNHNTSKRAIITVNKSGMIFLSNNNLCPHLGAYSSPVKLTKKMRRAIKKNNCLNR